MTYTVLWKPAAEQQLARLWMAAQDRAALAAAADRIDGLLKRDPQYQGESRGGRTRILIVPPLAVHFLVQDEDRLVYVSDVWSWTSPS